MAEIEKLYRSPFIGGNRVELLPGGEKAFGRMFDAIGRARRIILLQFYIFRNDETGTALSDILKAKASEGVKVYLLYDHLGSFGTPRSFWRGLREAGANVKASRPFIWTSPKKYQYRDHRKAFIIDGSTAFIGGLNIGDEYRGRLLKRKKPWRDTGVMIEGPVAATLTEIFKKAWKASGGGPIGYDAPHAVTAGDLDVIPIFTHSSRGRRRMRRLLYYSINHSRSEILLTTAYFIPSRRMLETLEAAVARGVRVRLLVPAKSDVSAAHHASRAFYSRLLRAGVEIYTYAGTMLHAKTYIFDRSWCVVGSANLDFRSLRWNDEGNAGILDKGFAGQMAQMFSDDLENSAKVDLGLWRQRPLLDKLREHFYSLFRMRL